MNSDEILDIVSAEDNVIGQEKRSVVYVQNLSCFRVINGLVCNSEKKLWIPRRHPNKKLFPLHLDASVGGHVTSGETYEEAFIRETQEELGLDVNTLLYRPIARLTPHEHKTSAFMWVYLIQCDSVPCYNKDDFTEFYWLSVQELLQKLTSGEKAKGDLRLILNEIQNKLE